MPAVSPERLRADIDSLKQSYHGPEVFVNALVRTLEKYADRTVRAGQSGQPAPLAPMFHTPRPVLRAIENALSDLVSDDPRLALESADQLWRNPVYEVRRMAISILTHLPEDYQEEVMWRVREWAPTDIDESLLARLFSTTLPQPRNMLAVIREWLDEGGPENTRRSLVAVAVLVTGPKGEDLPAIFRILSPLLIQAPSRHKPRLAEIIRTLAERAPEETSYYLRQLYINAGQPEIARVIRQNLGLFPPEMKASLQESLRRHN